MAILKYIAKLRMASIYHIVYYVRPELRGLRKDNNEFNNARKSVAKMLKRLQDVKLIKIAKSPKTLDVYYYLTQDGLRTVYAELNISEYDRFRKSGFDFELGFFDWRMPPYENPHFQFQTDIHSTVMSFNRGVEIDTVDNLSQKWQFGGVRLANICSVRDNLHASPRDTKIKEADLYKPDGELLFKQSRYNPNGVIEVETINQTQQVRTDFEYYFLEHDRKSEYGERLDAKFSRLNKRLEELEGRDELKYYKGMIVVLDELQNTSEAQVNTRHMKFVQAFRVNCPKYVKYFNIITTTHLNLPKALLSLRREYLQSFGKSLIDAFQFPILAKNFVFGDLSLESKAFTNVNAALGSMRLRYNSTGEYLCLFINIEGLSVLEWDIAINVFNFFTEQARKNNEAAANGDNSIRIYKVVPIVTYRNLRPFAPQMITSKMTLKEQEPFFNKLYVLNLSGSRPVLSKDGNAIEFEESEFIST